MKSLETKVAELFMKIPGHACELTKPKVIE